MTRGNWVLCPKCRRKVARLSPETGEIEFADKAQLRHPREGTFTFGDAVVSCPGGHRFRVAGKDSR